uniref:Transmembrane protein 267 n=1 Tax=Clastoptera arizonana TaxID=38151 RepID=A0A1B6CQP7_9HEMI
MNVITILPVVLGVFSILGDKILEITSEEILRAFVDNSVHGIIAFISWLIIVLKSNKYKIYVINPYCDLLLSFIIGSAIDIDHFVLAKSFRIKDALNLGEKRPILHCTSLPLAFLSVTVVLNWFWKLPRLSCFGWMVWVAVFSHHVRDGYRRGLWFWPVGSTAPIPYLLYILITVMLPNISLTMMIDFHAYHQFHLYSNVSVV